MRRAVAWHWGALGWFMGMVVVGCPAAPTDDRAFSPAGDGGSGAGEGGLGGLELARPGRPSIDLSGGDGGATSSGSSTGEGGSTVDGAGGSTVDGAGGSAAQGGAAASGGAGGAGPTGGAGGAGGCAADADCDDALACTVDACVGGVCVSTPDDSLCSGGTCDPVQGAAGSGCTPRGGGRCDDGAGGGGSGSSSTTSSGAGGQDADGGAGQVYVAVCVVRTCQGKVYACGDCLDDDGDGLVDDADDQCLGPCDNTEDSFYGGIPGQANAPCKQDCYFDKDDGSGNDDCFWSHECDALTPEPLECGFDPAASIPGYAGSCDDAAASQSATCGGYCGPLVPNGCDCFGCCAIPGLAYPVWLGSEDANGNGTCSIEVLGDPDKCRPCTQVGSCLNACETCELCVGKSSLPPECEDQLCPPGAAQCGLCGQPDCPAGQSCITGCCEPNP